MRVLIINFGWIIHMTNFMNCLLFGLTEERQIVILEVLDSNSKNFFVILQFKVPAPSSSRLGVDDQLPHYESNGKYVMMIRVNLKIKFSFIAELPLVKVDTGDHTYLD